MPTGWVCSRDLPRYSFFLLMDITDSCSETPGNSSNGMAKISKAKYCQVENKEVFSHLKDLNCTVHKLVKGYQENYHSEILV